jgi:hypothetical protein
MGIHFGKIRENAILMVAATHGIVKTLIRRVEGLLLCWKNRASKMFSLWFIIVGNQ